MNSWSPRPATAPGIEGKRDDRPSSEVMASSLDPAPDRAAIHLKEPLLTAGQAAELLNVRVSWIRDATRAGHLPALRVGRHLRYTRTLLEAWLGEQLDAGA